MSLVALGLGCSGDDEGRNQAWYPTGTGDDEAGDDVSSGADTSAGPSGPSGPSGTSAGSASSGSSTTCSSIAEQEGWNVFFCDQGSGVCADYASQPSDDCSVCCPGPSCDELAQLGGWDAVSCDQDGAGSCGGVGTPTWDCAYCCEASTGTEGGDESTGGAPGGFGYPVGDLTSYPAGGWQVWQVLGHYWADLGGRHLAQDIAHSDGGLATIDAPVHAVADGTVRYAGSNSSTYVNVVLIEHQVPGEASVCSFFGHIETPSVGTGDAVVRGQQISTVLDWATAAGGASTNTHLHYVLLSQELCDASAAALGSLICGYDTGGANGVETLADEPAYYTSVADICGVSVYRNAFISPTQFIESHHF